MIPIDPKMIDRFLAISRMNRKEGPFSLPLSKLKNICPVLMAGVGEMVSSY